MGRYSWVDNPEKPYATLETAFQNWGIVNEDAEYFLDGRTKEFVVKGRFDGKWGQQQFLLEQLAPVLRNCCIRVEFAELDELLLGISSCWFWVIKRHHFYDYDSPTNLTLEDELSDQDEENAFSQRNLSLAIFQKGG